MKILKTIILLTIPLLLTGCEGIFGSIYDDPEEPVHTVEGQMYIDASDWQKWYYIDLSALEEDADAEPIITEMGIPTSRSDESDGTSGIYNYWFDVWGQGLSVNHPDEKEPYIPTLPQPEPEKWTFAVHREVARTNGAEVFKTEYTSMDDLPESSAAFTDAVFTADEWSERDVWVVQDRMLLGTVGCQGIRINQVLSGWISCVLPPVPPAYSMDNHFFILRLPNGKYAALQLANYLSPSGTRCCLTINYKYPY